MDVSRTNNISVTTSSSVKVSTTNAKESICNNSSGKTNHFNVQRFNKKSLDIRSNNKALNIINSINNINYTNTATTAKSSSACTKDTTTATIATTTTTNNNNAMLLDRLSPGPAVTTSSSTSAPQSRSNSCRRRDRGSTRREKRTLTHTNSNSMPDNIHSSNNPLQNNLECGCHMCTTSERECRMCTTVRSFVTTSKGFIVDSGSRAKSLSSTSLWSSGSLAPSSRSSSTDRSRASSEESNVGRVTAATPPPSYFRVAVMGGAGVGKTSLVGQLTHPEGSTDHDDRRASHTGPVVAVQLDGQESTMEFIDGADVTDVESLRADAYVLVYAVSEPESFTLAASLLTYLRQEMGSDRTVYLVANKTDLVRQRIVSSAEAKEFALRHDCHFLETSTALAVNQDALLVGLLCRIKHTLTPHHQRPCSPALNHKCDRKCNCVLSTRKCERTLKVKGDSDKRAMSPSKAFSVFGNLLRYACRRDKDSRKRQLRPLPCA